VATYEFGHEGNHEVEKTNGFDESETQNGVREELATEGRVAGNAVQECSEDETDTDTGTSETNGGRAHTNVLGDLDHGLGNLRGVGTALDGEGLAGGGVDDGRHLLALGDLEGRGLAGGCNSCEKIFPLDRRSGSRWHHARGLRRQHHHTGVNKLTSHGPLAGVGKRDAGSRAGGLGGHLGGQTRGEHTGGGHCD
jgi:hypothetical protein